MEIYITRVPPFLHLKKDWLMEAFSFSAITYFMTCISLLALLRLPKRALD